MLVDAEPSQIAVKIFAILGRFEVAIGNAPIGDRASHAMHELLDGVLALGRVDLAVEIFADHNVGGELTPGRRNLTGRLFKEHLAIFALDGRRAQIPLGRVKRARHIRGAERGRDLDGHPGSVAGGV